MNQWNLLSKHFDGHEHGYNLELTHNAVFIPEVDGCEYHFIRVTESGEVYGATEDFMWISDNLTHLYPHAQDMYNGYVKLEMLGAISPEDITGEFRAYHDNLDDSEE